MVLSRTLFFSRIVPSIGNYVAVNRACSTEVVAATFAARFQGKLRYCHHTGDWYEWDGARWRRDETRQAFHYARELARESAKGRKQTEAKELGRRTFVSGVETFAQADARLAVTSAMWDRDPYLLGTPGGTVDLRTGEMHQPSPADVITKQTRCSPAVAVDCPLFLKFLGEKFYDDTALIRFVQQFSATPLRTSASISSCSVMVTAGTARVFCSRW